jgi:hypothetical protein
MDLGNGELGVGKLAPSLLHRSPDSPRHQSQNNEPDRHLQPKDESVFRGSGVVVHEAYCERWGAGEQYEFSAKLLNNGTTRDPRPLRETTR